MTNTIKDSMQGITEAAHKLQMLLDGRRDQELFSTPQIKPQRLSGPTVQYVEDVTQTDWYKEAFAELAGEDHSREDYEEYVRELCNQVGGGI